MKPVGVFLTAYNEARGLSPLLDAISPEYEVYVVDDGSMDATPEICRQKGVHLVRHAINLGQGNAVLTQFAVAIDSSHEFIVAMDADGQHDPAAIPSLLEALRVSGADVAQGSRVLGSNHASAPWARRTFLGPVTRLLNWVTGYRLTDAMCGFRAYRVSTLRRWREMFDRFQEPEYMASELWIRMARAEFRVVEVPVKLRDRHAGVSRKGSARYGWGVASAILRTVLDPPPSERP